jgi:hypothetical protein
MVWWGRGTGDLDVDVEVELMELLYVFRTSLETIPAAVPYLRVPEEKIKIRRAEMEILGLTAGMLNVGLVWSSGDWNPERNVVLAELERLARVDGVKLFQLATRQFSFLAAIADANWQRLTLFQQHP